MVKRIALVLGIGVFLAAPLVAQGGPFNAQLEAFWRVIATGGRTFSSLKVSTVMLGVGGAITQPYGTDSAIIGAVVDYSGVDPLAVQKMIVLGSGKLTAQNGPIPVVIGDNPLDPSYFQNATAAYESVLIGGENVVTAGVGSGPNEIFIFGHGNDTSGVADFFSQYIFGRSNDAGGNDQYIFGKGNGSSAAFDHVILVGRDLLASGSSQTWFGDTDNPVFITDPNFLLKWDTDAFGVFAANGMTYAAIRSANTPLRGVTGSIGGSLLAAGACTGGTATVAGATTAMVAAASPAADPDPALSTGVVWDAFVSSSNTVTVRVCGLAAVTPTATTYQVSVQP